MGIQDRNIETTMVWRDFKYAYKMPSFSQMNKETVIKWHELEWWWQLSSHKAFKLHHLQVCFSVLTFLCDVIAFTYGNSIVSSRLFSYIYSQTYFRINNKPELYALHVPNFLGSPNWKKYFNQLSWLQCFL